MHIRQTRHKALRQVRKGNQQHAPHPTQGIDIGVCAVRHGVAAKQIGHKGQLVRCQARQRDTGQRQRIDPDVADVDTALDRFDE